MMNIKTLAVPAFVAMSLIFTACASNQVETPDAVDGAVQDGIEGVEEGAGNAGDAINGGLENIEDGAKDLGKEIEDGAGAVKDGIDGSIEDTGNAVEDLGNEVPGDEVEAE